MQANPQTDWSGKPYHSLDYHLKTTFGKKVYRLSLDGGMTCPNRDGTIGTGGCIFCSEGGSGDFAATRGLSLDVQIASAKERVARSPTRTHMLLSLILRRCFPR